ncbi:hypothetical protein OF83DRAFT_1080738 [Amylostereum chailletii]|nr:hypothetical protein OF83DRAFT_1080738 [Amylostereum chailletii]
MQPQSQNAAKERKRRKWRKRVDVDGEEEGMEEEEQMVILSSPSPPRSFFPTHLNMHILPPRHFAKRQADVALPSASGLGAAATAVGTAVTGHSLLLGGTAAPEPTSVNVPFAQSPITVTDTLSQSPSPSASAAANSSSDSSSSSSNGLSTAVIIGITVAAFAVVTIVIFLVYGYLRRSWEKAVFDARRKAAAGAPTSAARNANGESGRQRARQETWNKLDDGDDRWETMEKQPGDMDATDIELFRKTSSVRSASDEKAFTAEGANQFDPSTMPNFAKYHPDLAQELAGSPPVRPYAARADVPVISWNSSHTTANESFLSLNRASADSMSPSSAAILKQTPPATSSTLHRWESAEVLTMDVAEAQSAEVVNPFADEVQSTNRTSGHGNPFFNAQPGKQNPFADPQSPRTRERKASVPMIRHISVPTVVESEEMVHQDDHAINSLLAALHSHENSPSLQRASLQPSMASSMYSGQRESMASFVMSSPKAM